MASLAKEEKVQDRNFEVEDISSGFCTFWWCVGYKSVPEIHSGKKEGKTMAKVHQSSIIEPIVRPLNVNLFNGHTNSYQQEIFEVEELFNIQRATVYTQEMPKKLKRIKNDCREDIIRFL
ncbi:hypothetical protein TNCV_3632861 [Trichonephila clavipes]|nr:hypothetical protein TNCV_3632861 [Trichonephila clavipes]